MLTLMQTLTVQTWCSLQTWWWWRTAGRAGLP